MINSNNPRRLWKPSQEFIRQSNLKAYMNWLASHHGLQFANYDELWEWSCKDTKSFWKTIYDYFDILEHGDLEFIHDDAPMPLTQWFKGSMLNYAEHSFRHAVDENLAILFKHENREVRSITWRSLKEQVASFRTYLLDQGVQKGDRVVAYLPNIPESVVAFLATCSIGAVWSSCSPDFGANSVIDRFQQIEPKVLITVDGYYYQGKPNDRVEEVQEIRDRLDSITAVVQIPYLNEEPFVEGATLWEDVMKLGGELVFNSVDFADPIWVLYSSGTTGQPKAITHSHGGVLLEHLKYVCFHNDVKLGERYFWYTTTGWMMWNFVQATLLAGATIVLYDGSPSYPDIETLWMLASDLKINHFGTSAPFIVSCMEKGLSPGESFDLSALRSISSTGSPLPSEGFDWIYGHVKKDVWLCSISGGTDVCSAFVGGCPMEEVYEGEIQRRALGCAMKAYDEEGQELVNDVGEMVVTKPMPSMPIYFWGDHGGKRYRESYFEMYPDVWRHGDWLEITDRHTLIISGRSDATLNRYGIRIGTAEIYQSVQKVKGIKDSLIVNLELDGGKHFMPLFVMLEEGEELDDQMRQQVNYQIIKDFSKRHVPDKVVGVGDIPYTISGKKMETPVKRVLQGKLKEEAANLGAMRNPESLDFFEKFKIQ